MFRKYPAAIAELTERISGYEKDAAIAKAHPKPTEAFVGMEILGANYTERKDAGKAIINACTSLNSPEPVPLGQYRGFSLSLQYDAAHTDYKLTLKGHLSHTISLSADAGGNITRMDNVVDGLEKTLETQRLALEEVKTQLANAKAEMEAPFAKEAELTEKSARLKELNILLNMDQKDRSVLEEGSEEEAPEKEKQRDMER